jgi:hypothetical protein
MATVWAILGGTFYFALVVNGWVRVDDHVDVHGLVAMIPIAVAQVIGESKLM